MAKIAIICKVSYTKGMGHLVRQSHIAKKLRGRGNEVTFFIPDYPPAEDWLDDRGLTHIKANDTEKISSDLIILDTQDTTSDFIKTIRKQNKIVVSFEDLGEGRNHVDLLIDCNIEYEKTEGLNALFGHNYSVMAEEFETYHSKTREFNNPMESVLITFGGTDPHSLTQIIIRKLVSIRPSLSITVIAGPGNKNIASLKNLANNDEKIQLHESTSEMAQTLFNHDAVFCAGGVTLHEAMAVGTPAFIINQVTHQSAKADRAEKQGAAINLGMADSWDENQLPEILQLNAGVLEKMSRAGKNSIDGKGLQRVVEAIELLL
ncbi:MAG: hypothetical protein F3741_00205 [Nitrospinae bacterium]|nr:hypothetical protein [Nitrospinota bacterium]